MCLISERAQERGLTPEQLEDLQELQGRRGGDGPAQRAR